MKLTALLVLCLVASLAAPLQAQTPEGDRILGTWVPGHGNARVAIEKQGERYGGRIVWLKSSQEPDELSARTDQKNPDPSLRERPLLGLQIMADFHYSGKGEWTQGSVYDPQKGRRYCGKITWIDANHLKLRGSLCGLPFLGRNDTWTRYDDSNDDG